MIDKRLINIKNLLKIIISCFVIVTLVKSCAKAYTKEDFNDFIDQILANTNIDSAVRDHATTFKYYANDIYNYMENNGLDISNYRGISVWASGSGLYYTSMYINLIPYNVTATKSSSTYYCQCDYVYRDKYNHFSKGNGNSVSGIASDAFTYAYFGLLDGLIPLTNNMIFENYYTPTIVFDYSPIYSVASGDFTYIKIDYVSNFIPLGVLGNNEYYQLDARFRDELSMKNLFNWSDVPGTRLNIK